MKTLRRVLVTHLVLFACAVPAARAQTGTVSGTVVNAATHEPIEGVLVTVHGAQLTALSRANGAFSVIGVPAGRYTVSARYIGFATREFTGVEVQAGHTRTINFDLRVSAADTTERSVFVAPFVDPKLGGSALTLTRDDMAALPVLTVAGALSVNGGFLELPRATATLSLADLHRGVRNLPSVRGAPSEATQYLLDGVAVNNPVFGSPPLLIEPLAAASVTFAPAHADAEIGGALAGVVNQSIRDGIGEDSGSLEYQSSALASVLGSARTGASRTSSLRGFVSGPLPLANGAVRFSLAGHFIGERANVLKQANGTWHGSGLDDNDQVIGKLTYAVRPTVMLSLSAAVQRRGVVGVDADFIEGDSVAPATIRDVTRFVAARIVKRFGNTSVSLTVADNHGARENCSIWQGVCVESRFIRKPVGTEIPAFPSPNLYPYAVTGQYFGGETYDTHVVRADVVSQVSDHHQAAAGIYVAQHEMSYRDAIGYRWYAGSILTVKDSYRARPTEFATYVQDALEYDLVTVHIGARFDYGSTGGVAFVDPLNPTNGTTALEVCEGTAPGINAVPFTYGTYRGIQACANAPADLTGRSVLLDSAIRLAQQDDMLRVRSRVAFSPRIGLSFPLTERSGLFFNIGRYNRSPLYHEAYRHSGTGSRAGFAPDGDDMCETRQARAGTTECLPILAMDSSVPDYAGNPNLTFEVSNAWEAGFMTEVGSAYSVDASFFANNIGHTPTLYTATQRPDVGLTYGVINRTPLRSVLSGGSSQTMGVTATLRRRATGPLSYTVSYTWQRSDEVGTRPDLVAEALATGETFNNIEDRLSARIHPLTFNAQFILQWRQETPRGLGPFTSAILRNSRTVATMYSASGTKSQLTSQSTCSPTTGQSCAAIGGGVAGTGTLVNLMYVRTIATAGVRWSLIARVLNVFDDDDGSRDIQLLRNRRSGSAGRRDQVHQGVSLRRILTGMSLTF